MPQFNVTLTYDVNAETPHHALALALASIDTGSGSVFVEVFPEGGSSTICEGFLNEFPRGEYAGEGAPDA